jgi:hypothetical protein
LSKDITAVTQPAERHLTKEITISWVVMPYRITDMSEEHASTFRTEKAEQDLRLPLARGLLE